MASAIPLTGLGLWGKAPQTTMVYITGFLVACAVGALLARRREVWGTTLIGPWSWVLMSLVALAAADYVSEVRGSGGYGSAVRLATAALTLCPGIALLGAKRPQERAWHFIVGSLWLVIALPAFQKFVRGQPGELQLHAAQSWFLAILLAVGVINSLFGKFGISAVCAGIGQLILLSPFLPYFGDSLHRWPFRWGIWTYSISIVVAAGISWLSRTRQPSIDSLWKDFRDAYGLAWTFRVAERLNTTARANGWNIAVGWGGFYCPDGKEMSEVPPDHLRAYQSLLHNLLRRFVSQAWIDRRKETLSR